MAKQGAPTVPVKSLPILTACLLAAAMLAVAGCGGGNDSSTLDYKAETKAVEKKLAAAEAEEAACVELLPENEYELQTTANDLARHGKTPGLSPAETEEFVHNLELEVREESNCIEEEQELEIILNHRLGYLSEAEEGFAAKRANEKAE
jgi:hypothetical protein